MCLEWNKMARFSLVGLVNTSVDLAVFSLCFYIFEIPLLVANSAAYVTAATNSFVINKYWTFAETRHLGHTHKQFMLFLVLGFCGLGLSTLLVWSLAHMMPEIGAKLASVGMLFVWNFATSRLIVFPSARS